MTHPDFTLDRFLRIVNGELEAPGSEVTDLIARATAIVCHEDAALIDAFRSLDPDRAEDAENFRHTVALALVTLMRRVRHDPSLFRASRETVQ